MADKAAVFIDGGYLSKVLKNQFGSAKINYKVFSDILCGGHERFRTYYYNCMPYQSNPSNEADRQRYSAMDSFIFSLKQIPRFEIRMGRLIRIGSTFEQKQVDMLFGLDMQKLSLTRAVQKIVIVTGDSDFVPAIKIAKEEGILIHLFYNKDEYVHRELLNCCDEHDYITKDIIDRSVLLEKK